ncbi:hypothetical protein [Phycicoccus sp. CSK15P-2]|uniref:hypothetical protein n=1 Tax=Phycicoccus sp. CSK15P-2 TaxID=2807627 RepID=UPI0019512EC3|nr:hypothetical protein [Phycicoccus sp. CSK15P-2]
MSKYLLTGHAQTQSDLAGHAGIGQPRASQILTDLADRGWVARARHRRVTWQVSHWDALLDWWLASYPGPGGVSSHWLGLEEPMVQVRAAYDVLDAASPAAEPSQEQLHPTLGGGLAADEYAPWAVPAHALLYAPVHADLTPAGLTPVAEQDATLTVTVPRDPGLRPAGALARFGRTLAPGTPLPLTDPFQVLWDLTSARTVDSDQAAGVLREHLRAAAAEVATREIPQA